MSEIDSVPLSDPLTRAARDETLIETAPSEAQPVTRLKAHLLKGYRGRIAGESTQAARLARWLDLPVDLAPPLGRRRGPFPAVLGQIQRLARHARRGIGMIAVQLELPVRHRDELDHLAEAGHLAAADVLQLPVIIGAIEALRFFDGDAIGR
ncbi:hypothetical protein, partial [Thiocapsa sp.]|uniref:hypothetical protein n=1 Tax=Thiocapsa sp. TaxID=2024551 RepID=UPI00359313BD